MADTLRAKFVLELDDRLTTAARRALGGFKRETDEVVRAAGRGNDSLGQFNRGLGNVDRTATRTRSSVRSLSGSVEKLNKDLEKGGKRGAGMWDVAWGNIASNSISKGFGAAVGAIDKSVDSARDFQKSLVGISKVARGADDTAEGFARIEAGVKSVSRELGVMPNEVGELTAALAPAFSGKIESGAAVDLVKISEDVTKIGTAWDVSGEEAGKFFADTARGLGYTTKQTKDLFGSINELGNQVGVKSRDIAEALQRSAGVLGASGISGETGAAINTALLAAGATPEIAGTGVRTLLTRLGAGSAASKSQKHALAQMGLDPVKVAKEMAAGGERAEKMLLRFVGLLNKLPKHKQLSVLSEAFGTESIGSIGAATRSVEVLGEAFKIAGNKDAAATSIQNEYNRVSGTSAAKADKLKAQISLLAIEFGNSLLPHIDKAVEFLTSPEGQEWGAKAVKSATEAVTGLVKVLKQGVDLFVSISEKISASDVALAALGASALKYGPKLLGLFKGMRGEDDGGAGYLDDVGGGGRRGRGRGRGGVAEALGMAANEDPDGRRRSGRGVTATGLAAAIPIIGYAAFKAAEASNEAATYDPDELAREGIAGAMRRRQVDEQRMQLGGLGDEDAARLQGMGGTVGETLARLRHEAQRENAVRFAEAASAVRAAQVQGAGALGGAAGPGFGAAPAGRGEIVVTVNDERASVDSVTNDGAAFGLRVARGAA